MKSSPEPDREIELQLDAALFVLGIGSGNMFFVRDEVYEHGNPHEQMTKTEEDRSSPLHLMKISQRHFRPRCQSHKDDKNCCDN